MKRPQVGRLLQRATLGCLLTLAGLALTACEDDAKTGSGTATNATTAASTPLPTSIVVHPSLGTFSDGALVTIKALNGSALGNAQVRGGLATVAVPTYEQPVVIEVSGGIGTRYYDEARGISQDFSSSDTLVAVVPRMRSPVGVTPITHAAYALLRSQKLGDLATASALDVALANTKAGCAFGIVVSTLCTESYAGAGIADSSNAVLLPPAAVGSSSDSLGATASGRYAVFLAAQAYIARDQNQTPWQLASYLAADFRDGTLDGRVTKTDTGSNLSASQFAPTLANYGTLLAGALGQVTSAMGTGPIRSQSKLVADTGTLVRNTNGLRLSDTSIRTGLTDAKYLVSNLQNTALPALGLFNNANFNPIPRTAARLMQDSIAPATDFIANRLVALVRGVDAFDDALAYTAQDTKGFVVTTDPSGATSNSVLSRSEGNFFRLYGVADCWGNSASPASITTITCRHLDAHSGVSGKPGNDTIYLTEWVFQRRSPGTSDTTLIYSVRRKQSTFRGLANWGADYTPPIIASASDVVGSGTVSYSKTPGQSVSQLLVTGTFPSLALTGESDQFQSLTITHTSGAPASYGLTGLATVSLGSGQSLSFDFNSNGWQSTAISVNENSAEYANIQSAAVVATIDSNDLRLQGALTLGSYTFGIGPSYDDRRPASYSFTGAISNPATVTETGTYHAAPLSATLTSWTASPAPSAPTNKVGAVSMDGNVNNAAYLQYGATLNTSGSSAQALRVGLGTTWLLVEPAWSNGAFSEVTSQYDVELRRDTTKTSVSFNIIASGSLVGTIENGVARFSDGTSITIRP